MNEAAAQICRLVPAMLTRRDELFTLARQVVRDSGYQYSKGHSRYVGFKGLSVVISSKATLLQLLQCLQVPFGQSLTVDHCPVASIELVSNALNPVLQC